MTISALQVAASNFKVQTVSTNCVLAYAANCTVGSLLVCAAWASFGSWISPTLTVSDDVNGAWPTAGALFQFNSVSGRVLQANIFYFPNNGSAGKPTVTCTESGGTSAHEVGLMMLEVSGIAAASPVDKFITNSGTSTNPTSGTSGTLSQADEFALAFAVNGASTTSGSGWTDDKQTAVDLFDHNEYRITAATTAISGDFTAASSTWGAIMATFKGAASGAAFIAPRPYLLNQAVKRAAFY